MSGSLASLIDSFSRFGPEAPNEQACLARICDFQSRGLRRMCGTGKVAKGSKCPTSTVLKAGSFRRGETFPRKLRPLSQPAGKHFSARGSCGGPANARKGHVEC